MTATDDDVARAKRAAMHAAWRADERRQTDAVLAAALRATAPSRQRALAARIRATPYPR